MKNTLKKLGNWIWNHKKILMIFAVVLAVGVFMNPTLASADDLGGDNSETVKSMAELANLFVKFLNTLLWPLLIIIGDLMDVDMITGPGMEERLIAIWVEMRNLVNIALALVLIVVAFYNVLGLGGGEGELAIKTVLPRIVLGLILVNFTYVGGKVILDIANVGTTIAFSLPQVMEQTSESQFRVDSQLDNFKQEVCYPSLTKDPGDDEIVGTEDDGPDVQTFYTKENAPIQTKLFCELVEEDPADTTTHTKPHKNEYGGLRESLESSYFSNLNKNNIAIVMAVNMGSLGSLELFKEGAIESFTDLTVNTIFALVMYAVFAVSYIVLAAVLIVRLIVIWLALALSPLAVLTYVVPQIKEWLGGGGDFAQKVIKHLVAPIIIGLTFSMGFMLMDGWSVISQDSMSVYSDSKVGDVISSEFLVSGIDDLPKLILAIASIVVVWMGVFAAANDTYAKGITGKIEEYGGMAKEAVLGGAMSLTTLPISVSGEPNENLSLAGLKTIFRGGLDQLSSGGPLPDEMKRLRDSDNPLVRFALGGGENRESATQSQTKMRELLSGVGADNKLDMGEARTLAGYLANIIDKNKSMNPEDRKGMSQKFLDLQRSIDRGTVPQRDAFQDIIDDYKDRKGEDGETLGLKGLEINSSDYDNIRDLKEVVRSEEDKDDKKPDAKPSSGAPTPPPAPPKTPKTEPAPVAPEPITPPEPPAVAPTE